jgi:hypothetical protein
MLHLIPIQKASQELRDTISAALQDYIVGEASKEFSAMPAELKPDVDKLLQVMTDLTVSKILAGQNPNELDEVVDKIFDEVSPANEDDPEAIRTSLRAATAQLEALASA